MIEVVIMAPAQARRAWLEATLEGEPQIHVAGVAPTFPFLRSLMSEIDADVALIDFGSAADSNLNQEWLMEVLETIPIIVLTSVPEAATVASLVRSERGALLRSDASTEQIVQAVKTVGAGLLVFDASLMAHNEPLDDPLEALTPREIEVLGLLAEGLANREIAARLNISEHTIKFHIRSILAKLGAATRTEAVTRGLRSGLIEL